MLCFSQGEDCDVWVLRLTNRPSFHQETNPQLRKHTIWESCSDFTGLQATSTRCAPAQSHHLPYGSERRLWLQQAESQGADVLLMPMHRRHKVVIAKDQCLERHLRKLLSHDSRLSGLMKNEDTFWTAPRPSSTGRSLSQSASILTVDSDSLPTYSILMEPNEMQSLRAEHLADHPIPKDSAHPEDPSLRDVAMLPSKFCADNCYTSTSGNFYEDEAKQQSYDPRQPAHLLPFRASDWTPYNFDSVGEPQRVATRSNRQFLDPPPLFAPKVLLHPSYEFDLCHTLLHHLSLTWCCMPPSA